MIRTSGLDLKQVVSFHAKSCFIHIAKTIFIAESSAVEFVGGGVFRMCLHAVLFKFVIFYSDRHVIRA